MTEPTRQVTISFTIPSRLHLALGLLLAAGAVAAYAIHFALDTGDPYRETAAYIGNLAGAVAAIYCVWCTSRGARSDTADLTEVTEAAIAAAAERQEDIRKRQEETRSTLEAATSTILLSLREIAGQLAEDRGAIKRLDDAVTEATGAVEALQDCYLAEGQLLLIPAQTEPPRNRALTA